MATNGMLVCSFFLKKRFSRGEDTLLPLNQPYSFDREDKVIEFDDFFQMITAFCQQKQEVLDDEKLQKLFSIQQRSYLEHDDATFHCCSFIVNSGSYGVEGDITNRYTQEVTHKRTEDEAEVKRFRVVIYIPKDVGDTSVKKGILVFQSIATFGVKIITTSNLKDFFAEYGLTFETRSVSVRAFIEKLIEQGNLSKITLINNHVSPNASDNMLISTGREETSYIRPMIKKEWLQRMLALFQRADETGIYEIPDGEGFDDISIQFKLGDRYRTVRLKNLEKLSIVEDIPDEVVRQGDPDTITRYMIQTADAYKDKMVF